MQKFFNRKAVSFALALTLTAAAVLGAPITVRAAETELETGFVSETDKPENTYEYAEATPSDAKESSSEEGDTGFPFLFVTSEEEPTEATPSDVEVPKAAALQTGKAAGAKAKTGGTEYDTVQEAIEAAAGGVSTTITMLEDSEENLDISKQKIIVLDLAGHILSAPAEGGIVIDNKGKLTITDSAPSAPHYFNYDTDGSLVLNTTATEGIAPDEIGELPAVVKLSGGCITGGNNPWHGGGILNGVDSSLTVTGCNIAGNTATTGGGIYISSGSTADLTDTVFFANTASGNGGALYLDSANEGDPAVPKTGQAKLERVLLTGNRAKNGGAVELYGFSCLLMKDCRVTANGASDNGGGIYKVNAGDKGVKCVLLNTEVTGNTAGVNGGGIYFDHCGACFAAGTPITMADGSVRNIEEIAEGDLVKTFDHETGNVSSAAVYYAYKGEAPAIPFTLTFDDGRTLSIVGCHDLLEKESRKYITVSEASADALVGSSFYGEDGQWHTLLSVAMESDPCDYYSIYTAEHQNCFANGLLSVPDDVDYMLNLYELDEDLKADEEKLASDIAEFGLYSFEEAKALRKVSRDWFDATGARYLNIAIGNGLLTHEDALALFDSVDGAGTEEAENGRAAKTGSDVKTFLCAALDFLGGLFVLPAYAGELSSATLTLDDFNKNVLTIGKGTKITGNTAGTAEPETNNVYLAHSSDDNTLIELTGDSHEGICVGITLQNAPAEAGPAVPFTTDGDHMSKADEAFFFSDKEDYVDRFSSENSCMELALSCCYIDANRNGRYDSGEICCKTVQAAVTEAGTAEQTVIRMTNDSEENVTIATGQDIVLDLNGFVLHSGSSGPVIHLNTCTFELKDSDTASVHYFKVSENGLWELQDGILSETYTFDTENGLRKNGVSYAEIPEENSIIAVYGGCITGGTGHTVTEGNICGGGIYGGGDDSTLTQNGGSIVGNCAVSGGGVHVSTYTLSGGAVCGNTAERGGGVYCNGMSAVSVDGGYVAYNTAASTTIGIGGGIYKYAGNLLVSGGSVLGNRAGTQGGGIWNGNIAEISGGTVSGNESAYGGGIFNSSTPARLTVSGTAAITGNRATEQGGGVFNSAGGYVPKIGPVAGGDFEMTGGKITGNEAPLGGGVTFGESVTLGGTANITGNTQPDGTTADDLYLPDGKTVTVSTVALPVAKDPADSSKAYMLVGIRPETALTEGTSVPVTGSNPADYSKNFCSDDPACGVRNAANNVVELYAGTALTSVAPIPDQIYTGSAIEPEVTVKAGETVLTKGTDYTVSYDNNVNVGTAAVTVVGQGIYSGTKTAQFAIVQNRPEPQPQPEPKKDNDNGTETTSIQFSPSAGGARWAHVTGSNGSDDWYYIKPDGTKATGWLLDTDGSWYYMQKDGGKNPGAMQTGWMTDPDDGYLYYLDPKTGKMLTGRAVIDGKQYYFNETVPSASGWTQNGNGDWVYSRHNITPLGAMIDQKKTR